MIRSLFQQIQHIPELRQAMIRLVITFSVLVVFFSAQFFYEDICHTIIWASLLYGFCSFVWFLWVYFRPEGGALRKYVGLFFDIGILNYGIAASSLVGISLYPLILWVIISYGYRYGISYLYAALAMSVVFFQVAVFSNPYWVGHHELFVMLELGFIALSVLFSQLLKEIQTLHVSLAKKAKSLEQKVYHDSLTKLKNREALNEHLQAKNFDALLLLDVNNFSYFNDSYGIQVGNEILVSISKCLTKVAYTNDLRAFRISGDSFVFLLDDAKDEEIFQQKLAYILDAFLPCKIKVESIGVCVNVSFTIALVKEQEQALEKANMTLHFARKRGEKFWQYEARLNRQEEIENILFWEKEISRAIQEDRIVPVFHPIVNKEGEIVKYETLMRLEKNDGKKVRLFSPHEFLDIAMKTNQYEQLTTIMIEKSFAVMSKVGKDFSINLTFSNIQNNQMVMFLKEKIDHYGLGDKLILEIVESEEIYNFEIVKTFVSYLRILGVRFAIDDFGSGYANYKHLIEVMPEYLKIDGSLIHSIDRDENAQKFVESIVLLAKNLGIKTIAEFVHNEEIFEITRRLGVDEFQGSYFYKPQILDTIEPIK